ncbi:hypothetical protein STENM223S_09779 [Streptomyces tendae]
MTSRWHIRQEGSGRHRRPASGTPEAQAYLRDYAVLLDSVPFPSLVVDHRWDVLLTNGAFLETRRQGGEPHPGRPGTTGANCLRDAQFTPVTATHIACSCEHAGELDACACWR